MRRKASEIVFINSEITKELVNNSGRTRAQIGSILGYSNTWLTGVIKTGRIGADDFRRMCDLGIDLTQAQITKAEHEAPTALMKDLAEIKNNGEELRKMLEEYSEARTQDATRIEESIDRLTNIMAELLFVLKG